MKVLYYNWIPLNTPGGGGVAVYIRNLLNYIVEHPQQIDAEPTFLSSGWLYDGGKMPYIRQEKTTWGVKSFSIINSPIIAPHSAAISQLPDFISSDKTMKNLFREFIMQHGLLT